MFGLTLEKLLLVGLIAAVVIGPQRLPAVVARLASLLRGLRATVDAARHRAATELGVPADVTEWRALDPRGTTRVASSPRPSRHRPSRSPPTRHPPPSRSSSRFRMPRTHRRSVTPEPPSAPMRRVRVGGSAHPRWIEVPDASEPAALASDVPAATDGGSDRAGRRHTA